MTTFKNNCFHTFVIQQNVWNRGFIENKIHKLLSNTVRKFIFSFCASNVRWSVTSMCLFILSVRWDY